MIAAARVRDMTAAAATAPAATAPAAGAIVDLAGVTPNAERDLHRWVARQPWSALIPELYKFEMPKDGRANVHFALLPHELFAAVYKAAPDLFDILFTGGRPHLERWWESARQVPSSHPVVAAVPPRWRVPLGMHGDGAGAHGGETVLVVTWGSVAVMKRPTLDTRLVFSMVKEGETVPDSLHTLYSVLAWSFRALADGVWPATDHWGRPFTDTFHRKRAAVAGQPLANGFRGAWVEMRGDWKFLRESLKLTSHYGTPGICHLCEAHRSEGNLLFTDFSRGAPHRATHVSNESWRATAAAAGSLSPLVDIPGFAIWSVYFDLMHTLDLGILQVAIPSALKELTDTAAAGGIFPGETLQQRVHAASNAYRDWCRSNKVSRFNSSTLL